MNRWVPRMCGLCILVIVCVAYVHALRAGHWPPSHPWSGIALVSLAMGQLLTPVATAAFPLRGARIAGCVFGCAAALLWLVAGFA
jgi:hypothetical protein